MQIDKDTIVEFIKSRVGAEKASEANRELPAKVDTERDAGLLSKFGVDVDQILEKLPGGLGDKIDKLPGGLGKKLDDLL
jgi:hypothetical protein